MVSVVVRGEVLGAVRFRLFGLVRDGSERLIAEFRSPRVTVSYARARGRISSTELASLVGDYASNVGTVLKRLEEDGVLAPSRASRRGKGFYYRYAGEASALPALFDASSPNSSIRISTGWVG